MMQESVNEGALRAALQSASEKVGLMTCVKEQLVSEVTARELRGGYGQVCARAWVRVRETPPCPLVRARGHPCPISPIYTHAHSWFRESRSPVPTPKTRVTEGKSPRYHTKRVKPLLKKKTTHATNFTQQRPGVHENKCNDNGMATPLFSRAFSKCK